MLCARSGRVKAEDAQVAGGLPGVAQSGVELAGGIGLDVQKELVFERPAMDGPALDFLQVDAVPGEGFQGRK